MHELWKSLRRWNDGPIASDHVGISRRHEISVNPGPARAALYHELRSPGREQFFEYLDCHPQTEC